MPVAVITGATGLIGGELCRLLIEQDWGIIALTRNDVPILGNDNRLIVEAPYLGLCPDKGELCRLPGDITEPSCGLDHGTQALIAMQADIVIHCAATTAFNASEAFYQQTNVAGTGNVLMLGKNKPFLHVSTAYVCGKRDGHIA